MIRFTATLPCPVCGGHERLPRGESRRCAGFLSDDGQWAHCERLESAGALQLDQRTTPPTYAHRIGGTCRCGNEHAPHVPAPSDRNGTAPPRRIAATYRYRDAAGAILYDVVRFEPKDFMPRRPDPTTGVMIAGLGGVGARVPYRLPELLAAPRRAVFWPEGEKDCDRLAEAGLLATTTHGGAKSYRKHAATYAEHFRGRGLVAVLPDNDDDGRAYAAEVAASLHAVGADVRVLELPGLPPKGDVSDWLGAGHTVAELKRLAMAAHAWTAEVDTDHPPETSTMPPGVGVLLSDVEAESISWLWPSRLARGKVTLVDGDPGLGKSVLSIDWTARVTTGRPWPDGAHCPAAGVVILSAEDGLADTIRPRLDAAGADVSRVLALQTAGADSHEVMIPADLRTLEQAIERVNAGLVIVDPLMAYLGGDTNSHRDQDVRRALRPLADLADRAGVAVVVVRHLNKAVGGSPLYRGGGSIGIIGAARIALLVGADPEDESRRVLAALKTNIGPKPPALSYRLEQAPNGTVRVAWEDGECHLSAAQLLAAPVEEEERSQVAEACRVMQELLADGPLPAGPKNALKSRIADEAGVSLRTVDTAKARLGVVSRKAGLAGGWAWALPDGRSQRPSERRNPSEATTFPDPLRSSPNAHDLSRSDSAYEEVF